MMALTTTRRKLFLGIIILLFLNLSLFTCWTINGSGSAYNGGDDSGSSSGDTTSSANNAGVIDIYIALAGGYFLESYAKTLTFMNKTELAALYGMNYNELQVLLNDALLNMELANQTYGYLHQIAVNTPYNPEVIQALKDFNYHDFCSENHCSREIFSQVQSFLSNGKVTEMYGKIIDHTQEIIDLLQLVKGDIDQRTFPSTKNVRQLNQAYSTALLFGQYIAEIFEAL
jgi:hypothetical protein